MKEYAVEIDQRAMLRVLEEQMGEERTDEQKSDDTNAAMSAMVPHIFTIMLAAKIEPDEFDTMMKGLVRVCMIFLAKESGEEIRCDCPKCKAKRPSQTIH